MNRDPSSSNSRVSGARVHPLDWAQAAAAEDLVEREMTVCIRRRNRRRVAASTLMLIALAFTGVLWRQHETPAAAGPNPRAHVSLPARQVLPDGSVVDLKDGAAIDVDYGASLRRVSLRQGEAHFQVAKNPARPFVVTARGVEVHAVGTAFLVQLERTGIEVVVTEGRVAVDATSRGEKTEPEGKPLSPSLTPGPASIRVDAGNRVSIDTALSTRAVTPVQPVPAAELAQRLAWRVPRLEFDSTPLSEVIPIFNQYGNVQLSYSDPELGKLKLSGVLRGDNVAVLLQILKSSYGLEAEHRPTGEIVLRRGL